MSVPDTGGVSPQTRPASYPYPLLIMMSGLPGTGKSYVSQQLATSLLAVVVESDRVRKELFPHPNYGSMENSITHGACRRLMRYHLGRGNIVVYDATNLIEFQRRTVYALARACRAPLLIVRTTTAVEEVRNRLRERTLRPDRSSDADWKVYMRLAGSQEPIAREHIHLDTTGNTDRDLCQIVQAIRRAATTGTWPTYQLKGESNGAQGVSGPGIVL